MEFFRQSFVIAGKDLRVELRSRERLVSTLTFALLVAVVFKFSLDPIVIPGSIMGAMLWVTILFAGMLGLGRSFSMEKEQDAMTGILLTPIGRGALFFGKFLANLALLMTGVCAIYLVYTVFFDLTVIGSSAGLAAVTTLGCIGFMALGTLFSAVSTNTRMGDTLLPILLLPLLIPVVIYAAWATQQLLMGRPLSGVVDNIRMLAAFDLIFLIVCTMIFDSVVEE